MATRRARSPIAAGTSASWPAWRTPWRPSGGRSRGLPVPGDRCPPDRGRSSWWSSTTAGWTGSPTGRERSPTCPGAQIRQARVGGTEPIPLLSELLEEFPDARFNIDAKSDAAVGPLAELIRSDRTPCDRVCLGSFSDHRLAAAARTARTRRDHLDGLAGDLPAGPGQRAAPTDSAPQPGAAQVPRQLPPGADRHAPVPGHRAVGRHSRCTSGRSTIRPRCAGCSTSASTAS